MVISSDDLLYFSKRSLNCNSEVTYRAIVSRGYYGLYHKTLSILKHYTATTKSTHASLIKYLNDPLLHHNEPYSSSVLRELAYILRKERNSRVAADYDLSSKVFTKKYAELAVMSQDKYIQIIEKLLKTKK